MRIWFLCLVLFATGYASVKAVTRDSAAIGLQEKALVESQRHADQLKAQLDALDRSRDKAEQAAQESIEPNELDIARAELASLEAQRQAIARQQSLDRIEERTRWENRRMTAEIQGAQYRDQISREQALLATLNGKVVEARASGMETDSLRVTERAASLQAQRVSELQAGYFDLQRSYGERENAFLASQSAQDPARLAAMDDQIRKQQDVVNQLEQRRDEHARRQQAGMVSLEGLQERYLEVKRDYDEQTSRVEEQRDELARMKQKSN